ncbi:soluble quino protein glucose dehydrogenase [Daldinia vernicosa]|uniref:soluble quino protein glucose dehydrogenase n=1 Tax=Daldinia vernicosa TaxID=114800 RepID=UPI002008BF43|nr:soluble quino protein glucose dehydrogenase [Daldinia vernicosa]KAI0846273.1 soluble quino protein glucose dehydrogenase [Daldinia vernicosa]
MRLLTTASVVAALVGQVLSQNPPTFPFPSSCSGVDAPRYAFTVDSGWQVTKIASGLRQPRTIIFDPLGHMLVLQATSGISVHTFGPDGCINSTKTLFQNSGLNHGLSLTPDGKTLYASSQTTAWSWTYDAAALTLTNQKTVVSGIGQGIHSTRTTLVSPKNPNLIIVSVGAASNWDNPTIDPSVGRAIVKVFDVSKAPANGYQFNSQGTVLGYGLRNEVALAFDPNGHVWGAENSGDDFRRTVNGQSSDIHIDNPAEELNYLGDPAAPLENNWFGYPTCFTVWEPSNFRDNTALKTGSQFVVSPNSTFNDASCEGKAIPPRLSFPAHMAPITNAFDPAGENLYITFHGSWDRQPAQGYFVAEVPFKKNADGGYEPVAAADSKTGYKNIIGAQNPGSCNSPSLTMSSCWRLAGLSWDQAGERLFVSSDNQASGEIFVLRKKA